MFVVLTSLSLALADDSRVVGGLLGGPPPATASTGAKVTPLASCALYEIATPIDVGNARDIYGAAFRKAYDGSPDVLQPVTGNRAECGLARFSAPVDGVISLVSQSRGSVFTVLRNGVPVLRNGGYGYYALHLAVLKDDRLVVVVTDADELGYAVAHFTPLAVNIEPLQLPNVTPIVPGEVQKASLKLETGGNVYFFVPKPGTSYAYLAPKTNTSYFYKVHTGLALSQEETSYIGHAGASILVQPESTPGAAFLWVLPSGFEEDDVSVSFRVIPVE